MNNPLRLVLIAIPVFPFFILFGYFATQFNFPVNLDWAELQWALANTTMQAGISSLLSLVVGWFMAEALVAIGERFFWLRRTTEVFLLLPNLLPSLFIILSVLQVVDPYPIGILGISFVHMIMNAGFVALLIAQLFENKIGSHAEMSYLFGASRWQFIRRVALPQMAPDLLKIFGFVFIICFTSFSVPLILGGGRGTTLEVLIYEKIHISNEWTQAVYLSLFQSLILAGFGLVKVKSTLQRRNTKFNLTLIKNYGWIVLIACYVLVAFAGYITGAEKSLSALMALPQLNFLWPTLVNTWVIGLLVGICSFLLLCGVVYISPDQWVAKSLMFLVSPSQVLIAFSLLLVGPNSGSWPFLKVIGALVCMQFVPLFRSGLASNLQMLEGQLKMAQIMGARPTLIFFKVAFPQVSKQIGSLSGMASLWAFGDFGIAKILFEEPKTLGMQIEALLSSYRIDAALGLGIILLLMGVLQYFFFWGLGNVFSRKS